MFTLTDAWASSDEERRLDLLKQFQRDRKLAHKFLFAHRHKDEDAEFVDEMLDLLYSQDQMAVMLAFRGAAKSTYAEEWLLLSVLFKELVFPLMISYKEEMAAEHLAPVRNELETNDKLIDLFGDQKSYPWSATELGLANGAKIQAIGAGQSMRGKKHNDERPDAALIDDLEDEDSILTDTQRHKTDRWLMGTLIPALHPTRRRVRFVGTAIHPKSLIVRKVKDPRWKAAIFPLVRIDKETGEEKSTWPSRFPMSYVRQMREDYLNAGNFVEFEQEYMCRAEDIAGKPFQPSMIKVEPVPLTYLPVEMMVDPARTTKDKSARTGYAAWSWSGNKLIVHKAVGHFHKPDEIINEIVAWDEKYKPVHIGVEAVGLEDFILQPLRSKCLQIGRSMPYMDVRAPKDKISFIKGLQPFYIAGEVIHVEHHPDLESELVQFPTGRIDVLNALAYALRLRAGRPVYEDFGVRHIAPVLEPDPNGTLYLCVSSRPSMTAGVLLQYADDAVKIYKDWVYNEPPRECFGRMLREAILEAGKGVKIAAPADQFNDYTNTGLPAAIRAEQLQAVHLSTAHTSEGSLRTWMGRQIHGGPAFLVRADARWTINGLALGYARKLDKHGKLMEQPTDDQYRVVAEAIESFVAWFDKSASMQEDDGFKLARTSGGRSYYSLRPE
jgi:hypothetical protein